MKALLVVALLASAAPVAAQSGSSTSATQPQVGERKICRNVGRGSYTSTRISHRRVCLTQQQWRERGGGSQVEEGADTIDAQQSGNGIAIPNNYAGGAVEGDSLSRTTSGGVSPRS